MGRVELRGTVEMVLARLESNPGSVDEWNIIVSALRDALQLAQSERLVLVPGPKPGEPTRVWQRRVGITD